MWLCKAPSKRPISIWLVRQPERTSQRKSSTYAERVVDLLDVAYREGGKPKVATRQEPAAPHPRLGHRADRRRRARALAAKRIPNAGGTRAALPMLAEAPPGRLSRIRTQARSYYTGPRRGMAARAIELKLTAVGKDERAISISGYVHREMVKYTGRAFNKTVLYKQRSTNHLLDQSRVSGSATKTATARTTSSTLSAMVLLSLSEIAEGSGLKAKA